MPGAKVSSREAMAALESAVCMAEVSRDAGELAVERELDYICTELRKNEPLLYRLSVYLKDDSLVALLDGRMNATVGRVNEVFSSGKCSKPSNGVLRQAWRKWEHIQEFTRFLVCLLRAAWGMEINSVCPEEFKINGEAY